MLKDQQTCVAYIFTKTVWSDAWLFCITGIVCVFFLKNSFDIFIYCLASIELRAVCTPVFLNSLSSQQSCEFGLAEGA